MCLEEDVSSLEVGPHQSSCTVRFHPDKNSITLELTEMLEFSSTKQGKIWPGSHSYQQ